MAARMSPAEFRRLAGTLRAVLLFYWFGEAHSYAWVVSADAIHMVTLPASEQQIDALIREYRWRYFCKLKDTSEHSQHKTVES